MATRELTFDVIGRGQASGLERIARQLDEVERELRGLDRRRAEPEIDVDTLSASARLAAMRRQVERLDGQRAEIKVDVDKGGRAAGALSRIGSAVTEGVAGGFRLAGRAASGFAGELADVVSRSSSVVGTFIKLGAVSFAAAAGGAAITAAYGAAATAVAVLPGAIALMAAPIAAVVIGIEGIKRAAETLRPEFDRLKASVEGAFEQGMLPVFEELRDEAMPALQTGLTNIATSISAAALELSKFVSHGPGLDLVRGVLSGVDSAIRNMTPGLVKAADGLLQVASRQVLFDGLSEAVNRFGDAFRTSVIDLIKDGTLDRAFQGLTDVLGSVTEGFVSLVDNGITLFANAAPGVDKVIQSLTGFFNRFDWASLGDSVGGVFSGLAETIDGIDTGTIREIEDAFAELADVFKDPEVQKNIQSFVDSFPEIIRTVDGFARDFASALNGIGQAFTVFDTLDQKFRTFVDDFNATAERWGKDLGLAQSDFAQWLRDMDQALDDFFGTSEPRHGGGGTFDQSVGGGGFLSDLFGNLFGDSGISDIFDQIADSIREMGPDLTQAAKDAVADVPAAVSEGLSNVATSVGPAMDQVTTAIQTGLSTIQPLVQTAFAQLGATATVGMQQFALAVTTGMTTAQTAVQTGMQLLTMAVTTGMQAVQLAIQTGFQQVGLAAQLGMQQLTLAVQNGMLAVQMAMLLGLNQLTLTVQTAFLQIRLAVTLGMQQLTLAVQTGMLAVQLAFQQGFLLIGLAVQQAFLQIGLFVQTGMQQIALFVQTGMQQIALFVQTGMQQLMLIIQTGLVQIQTIWQAGWLQIQTITTQAMQQIVTTVTAGMAQMVAAVQAGVQAMVSALQSGMQQAVSVVQSAVQQMVSALQAAIPQFRQAGVNMGRALAEGLRSQVGAVRAAAAELAAAASAGLAAAAQIRSPSRVFIGLGEQLGAGLAVGMDNSASDIIGSARRLADAAHTQMPTFGAGRDGALPHGGPLAAGAEDRVSQKMDELITLLRDREGITIPIYDQSGDPAETAQAVRLRLRMA